MTQLPSSSLFVNCLGKSILMLLPLRDIFSVLQHPSDLCALKPVFARPSSFKFALEGSILVSPLGQANNNTATSQNGFSWKSYKVLLAHGRVIRTRYKTRISDFQLGEASISFSVAVWGTASKSSTLLNRHFFFIAFNAKINAES